MRISDGSSDVCSSDLEKQVTLGETTHRLAEPFLVLATQNPIEHEGTYPLPEAQVDRFMLKVQVSYPARGDEREIIARMYGLAPPEVRPDRKSVLQGTSVCVSVDVGVRRIVKNK